MGIKGVFGYIIGKIKYITYVHHDADLLYDILIRELNILLNKFGSIEVLQTEFQKIKIINETVPTHEDIEKCKYFTDLDVGQSTVNDWYCLLRGCQSSFINLLFAGRILNQTEEYGYAVFLDFNKKVLEASGDFDYASLTMEEIITREDMPIKTYDEIIHELKERYEIYINKMQDINDVFKQDEIMVMNIIDDNIRKKLLTILHRNEKKCKMIINRNEFRVRLTDLKMLEMDDK
jgi:hypothetical protein